MYIALGSAMVVVLGVIAYLGMGSDTSFEAGPPVLEENPALSGTLTAEGDRYFRVENDFESGSLASANVADNEQGAYLLQYQTKTPSNFLLFTAPRNVATVTVDRVAEDLLVDDGLSGYVLGTYRPTEGGWNLYPNKNYLGAQLLDASDTLRSCETYFVIKIADDHNNANGFGTANGWDAAERSKIAFDQNFFDSINTGTADCSTDERGIVANSWNMMTVDIDAPDALLGFFSGYDEVKAIWDTTVINQIDRTVDPAMTRNANQMLYTLTENRLVDYYNGGIKSAEIFDFDASYDGGKQDLWVYVGDEYSAPVNTPPELTPNDVTVNIDSRVDEAIKLARSEGRLTPIETFMNEVVMLPQERSFGVLDAENDALTLTAVNNNQFSLSLSGNDVVANSTSLTYKDLNLSGTNPSDVTFMVGTQVSDGDLTANSEAGITYEWNNRCVDVSIAYAQHLQNTLKEMVYQEYRVNDNLFDQAKNTVIEKVEAEIASEGDDARRAAYESIWESLRRYVEQLTFEESYLEQPPYLPAECGSGFGACVDVAVCGVLVQAVPVESLPFGRALEKLAFSGEVESPAMESASLVEPNQTEESTTTSSSTVQYDSATAETEPNFYSGGFEQSDTFQSYNGDTQVQTNEDFCLSKQLASADVEWVSGSETLSSEVANASDSNELRASELELLVDIDTCAGLWEVASYDSTGSYVIEVMQVGKIYEVDSSMVFVRDAIGEGNTANYATAHMVLGSDNRIGVFFSLEDEKSGFNPIRGFDDPELTIADGVFWMNGNDLNGITTKKRQ